MVYRYADVDDGVPGGEASFAVCTFWLVEVLAAMGEPARAREVFEGMAQRARPLGLLAEQIDPRTGDLRGNFPQGLTHMALVNAAVALERLEAQAGAELPRRAAAEPHEP